LYNEKVCEVIKMASSKAYLDFVLDELGGSDEVSYRPMMGEYVLYFGGKVIGGVYDDRLLVKKTPSALALLPTAPLVRPYDGAKEMLLVEDVEQGAFLRSVFAAVADDLPQGKKK